MNQNPMQPNPITAEQPTYERLDERLDEMDCSPSLVGHEYEQEKCGTTHYAGCACHEKGWENKWKCAVEMAARAQLERDAAVRVLRVLKSDIDHIGHWIPDPCREMVESFLSAQRKMCRRSADERLTNHEK